MKRRRLRSKQRPPPCYDEKRESEDGHVLPLAASAAVAVGESHACEAGPAEGEIVDAANAALAEAVDNDGHEKADAAIRWQLLSKYKTVQGLVAAVIREKSDEELHNISINIILDDIQAKASNKISMSELLEEKDEFVAATMSAVPKELSRRLLLAVNKPQAHAGRPAQIDSQCVQKTYLLTFSNLDPSNAPTRETILETVLQAFGAGGYGSDVCVTPASSGRRMAVDSGTSMCRQHCRTLVDGLDGEKSCRKLATLLILPTRLLMTTASAEKCNMPICCGTSGCHLTRRACPPWTKIPCRGAVGPGSIRLF